MSCDDDARLRMLSAVNVVAWGHEDQMNDMQKVKAVELSSFLPNRYTKFALGLVVVYDIFLFSPVVVLDRALNLVITGQDFAEWPGYLVLLAGLFAALFHLHPSTLPFYKIGKYALMAVFALATIMALSNFIDLLNDPLLEGFFRREGVPFGFGAIMWLISLVLFVFVVLARPINNIAVKE